ncbi:NAD-P-binding protein [Mytilinidion resinicola]|uniref:NAD-P-binding protein n=1 Tax=Mytilinidion resinicola TaxID=574789 RepID=A0A6A6Z117_9PEZI|nr:NAD-P-binding protein [Mytilinidion resinicola]KAF2813917.1 NAD-P-binding protein [Mytilinidion resinicola]
MASSPKIRVALIGLNAPYAGTPTGVNWTANAHLPYLRDSSKYELVALQNSSAERAAKSIKAHGLDPKKVKAYGTPEEVANDPNIDLVVSSIRVDRHAGSLIPSIKAGKDVYVEWPVEANYSIAKELTDLAKAHNVRNVVGIQGSFSPIATKIKALIDGGELGRVTSSTTITTLNYVGPTIPSFIDYFVDKKTGGNPFTIDFGHVLECLKAVLGEISTHHSLLVNQYPEVDVVDPATREVIEKGRKNTVPNQVVFDAILKSGAVLTYKQHDAAGIPPGATPRKDKSRLPVFDWRIFGSKAEVRVTSYDSIFPNIGSNDFKVEICKAEDGAVVEVDLGTDDFGHLPEAARNIARLYEAFAAGVDEKNEKRVWYPDFEYALKTHELIEGMYRENGF